MLMTAISANAQTVIFGQYVGGAFVENADNSKIGVNLNPHCLTFACAIANSQLESIVESDNRLTIAFAGVRNADNEYFQNSEFRMVKVTPSNYAAYGNIYYVNQLDLGLVPANPTVAGGKTHLHAQILVSASQAALDADPNFQYWWDQSTQAGWNPGNAYQYMGEWSESNTQCAASVPQASSNVEKEPVAYYTILGVQLSEEPTTGMYIVKYSDGSSAKFVK